MPRVQLPMTNNTDDCSIATVVCNGVDVKTRALPVSNLLPQLFDIGLQMKRDYLKLIRPPDIDCRRILVLPRFFFLLLLLFR